MKDFLVKLAERTSILVLIVGLLLFLIGISGELTFGSFTYSLPGKIEQIITAVVGIIICVVGIYILFRETTEIQRGDLGKNTKNKGIDAGFEKDVPLIVKERKSRLAEQKLLTSIPTYTETAVSLEELTKDSENNPIEILRLTSILTLCRDLGLLTIDENLNIRPVSTLAGCFLRSMGLHLKYRLDFIGGWKSDGRDNEDAQRPRNILRMIEQRRIKESPQGKIEPVRYAKSALVLIKAKYGSEDRYLLQWSDSWDPGRYWFIGGVMEAGDNSFRECAYRELREELNLTSSDITALQAIGKKVEDVRISKRLGAYTEYEYALFYALLDTKRKEIQDLFRLKAIIKTPGKDWQMIERNNVWQTWDEIRDSPQLQEDASVVLDELENLVHSIPANLEQVTDE